MRLRRITFHETARLSPENWALAIWLGRQSGAEAVVATAASPWVELRYGGNA